MKLGSKEEWQKYREALRQGDRAGAAEAFRRYQEARRAEGKGGSKPTLVNLSTRAKAYPNAVPLDEIPEALENPEFFELMKRIVVKKEG